MKEHDSTARYQKKTKDKIVRILQVVALCNSFGEGKGTRRLKEKKAKEAQGTI